MKRLLAALLIATSLPAFAGGTAFACRYVSLNDEGAGSFILTLNAIEEPGEAVTYAANRQLVLHIHYSARSPLPSGHPAVTRADFDAAIARIRQDLARGDVTRFGIFGSALVPVKNQPGHYRVYGLRLEDEHDPEKPHAVPVVYAY
jgi:hypothetical protein